MPYSHSSVDEQVVKMSFDNSNFDSNINDSIKALNSLDIKLGSLNKQNFEGLTNSINNLATNFTVKGQIMFGVLARLGSEIVSISKRAINKLTQGVRDGLGEYNQIIDATQTIFANVKQSGASIDDVNRALDELNEYADLTIYNFGQMTRMIGMFTSAGVSLNKSVSTIKGLANAAALVGATPEKAQVAWNAVSRAMSSGTFTNLTWKSLELSNIAGKQFNKVITEVARANKVVGTSGKNIDQMIKKYGTLRETLREKWLTKDVFNEAMQIMSGDLDRDAMKKKGYTDKQIKELTEIAKAATEAATQVKTFKQLMETTGEAIGSGWAQSFRILIGDLEVAKKLYTRISSVISDFIDNNANIRNKLFKQIMVEEDNEVFKELKTGRDTFRQIIENMLAIVKTFLKSVKTGFLNIFPIDRISEAAKKVLNIVNNFTKALVINKGEINKDGFIEWDTHNIDSITESIKDLIRFFRGLAAVVDTAWMAFSQPIKVIIKRIPFLNNFFNNTNNNIISILKKLGAFGDKITVFRDAVKDTQIFGTVLELVLDNIDELGKEYPILGAILWVFRGIRSIAEKVGVAFKKMNIKPLSALFGAFKMIVTSIWKVLNALFNLLKNAKNSVDWSWLDGPKKAIMNFLKALSDYGSGLVSFEQVTGKIGQTLGKIFEKIKRVFNNFGKKNNIVRATGEVNKYYSNLNKTTGTLGEKISLVWGKVKSFFTPIGDFFKKLRENSDFTFDGIAKKIALIGGGVAAASLTISQLVKTFGKIKIIDNINELLTAGVDVIKAYQKEAQSKMILNIAAAIGILAASMAVLAFIPYDKLENGLVVFSSFMAVLSVTLTPIITAIARFNESIEKTRKVLTGWDVLNNSVKQLGKFGKQVAKGINAKLIGQSYKDIAAALLILVGAIAALVLLFKLDGPTTERAIKNIINLVFALSIAVGGLAGAIAIISKFGSEAKNAVSIFSTFFTLAGVATVILAIAAAVAILAGSLAKITSLDSRKLRRNFDYLKELLLWIGGIAAVLAGGVAALSRWSKSSIGIAGVATVIVSISAAVWIISNAVSKLASADTKVLRKVFNYVTELTKTIGLVAALLAAIITIARVFGDAANKTGIVVSSAVVSLLAVASAIYVLGKTSPIDPTVITVLRTLTIALGIVVSLLALIAIVTSRAKTTFSTNFADVLNKILVGIGVVIASIGTLTAGLALLISTLSKDTISDGDINRATNNIVVKLGAIASSIKKVIPKLKEVFYNLGKYVGSVFTSFALGFVENIVSTGEVYDQIAVKFVNLVIDILGKVLSVLSSRKEDIKRIIRQVVDLIAGIITEVVNDVFYKNSNFKWKEEDILKLLGFGGLTIGGGSLILKLAGNFNTLNTSVKNFKDIFKIGGISDYFKPLLGDAKAGVDLFKEAAKSGKEVKTAFGLAAESIGKAAASMAAFAAALWLIKIGVNSLRIGIGQMHGEAKYIRSDVNDWGSAFKAFFEDADFRAQTFVDTFKFLGEVITTVIMTIVNAIKLCRGIIEYVFMEPLLIIANLWADFFDMIGQKDLAKKITDVTKIINKDLEENVAKPWAQIKNDWTHWDTFDYSGNVIDGAKKTADAVDEGTEIISSAIENGGKEIANTAGNASSGYLDAFFGMTKDAWNKIAPSVQEAIKNNARQLGLYSDTGNESTTITMKIKVDDEEYRKVQEAMRNGTMDASSYQAYMKTHNAEQEKTVEINKQYLDLIIEEKENLAGLDKEQQINYILARAKAKGIQEDMRGLGQTYAAILLMQQDQTKLAIDGIDAMNTKTTATIAEAFGDQTAAVDSYIADQMNSMNLLVEIAEENKDELVGKKKEEVIEILKQEAIKRGLTEEEAEEAAKNLIATETGTGKTLETISSKELQSKIDIFKDEYDAFKKIEELKTDYATKAAALREKLAANEAVAVSKALETGTYEGSLQDFLKKNQAALKEKSDLESQLRALEKEYNDKVSGIENSIKKRWESQGMSTDDINKKWNENVDEYKNLAKDAKTSTKPVTQTIKETLKNFINKAFGGVASDVDTKTWNQGKDGTVGSTGNDRDKAVAAAKDLKTDLEAQRADLTPTFDLDKLASDANKANGIVMSSLMAAQNASIGDYINKDSELNPFMKDRWQNVYNFTQNNYSPKALSRIDIYRQTQRQISMSRGF